VALEKSSRSIEFLAGLLLLAGCGVLTACGGGDDDDPSPTPTDGDKEALTLSGFCTVTDPDEEEEEDSGAIAVSKAGVGSALAAATVTVIVDGEETTVETDEDGYYSVTIEAEPDAFVSIRAEGQGDQAAVVVSSLLGEVATLLDQAGPDATLSVDENIRVNATQLSTAEAVLAAEASAAPIDDDATLAAALAAIDADVELDLAGAIVLAAHDERFPLPAGVGSTLDLVDDDGARTAYLDEVTSTPEGQAALDAAIAQTLADPSVIDAGSAPDLVGEKVFLYYPVEEHPDDYLQVIELVDVLDLTQDDPGVPDGQGGEWYGANSSSGVVWSIEGAALSIRPAEGDAFSSTTYGTVSTVCGGDTGGEFLNEVQSLVQLDVAVLGANSASVTSLYRYSYPDNPEIESCELSFAAGRRVARPAELERLQPEDTAPRIALTVPYLDTPEGGAWLNEDILSANSGQTGGTAYFGEGSYSLDVDDGGIAKINFGDQGSSIAYKLVTNADGTLWLVLNDVVTPDGSSRANIELAQHGGETTAFVSTEVPGCYYQYGPGDPAIYYPDLTEEQYGQLKGFRIVYSENGTANTYYDFFYDMDGDGQIEYVDQPADDPAFPPYRWRIGDEGQVVLDLAWNAVTESYCDITTDLSGNCVLERRREWFIVDHRDALDAYGERYYLVERRDFDSGTPELYDYIGRFYVKSPNAICEDEGPFDASDFPLVSGDTGQFGDIAKDGNGSSSGVPADPPPKLYHRTRPQAERMQERLIDTHH